MSDYDHLFKLLLVGGESSGKSSLLLRYCDDSFTESYIATIGVDFKIKTVQANGKTVKLQIWDTAGQERFQTISVSFYRGADGVFICGNLSSPDGFDQLERKWDEIEKFGPEGVPRIVVGCKSDLGADPAAVRKMNDFCDSRDVTSVTCSAKSSTGVNECFEEMVRQIMAHKNGGGKPAPVDDDEDADHKQKKAKKTSSSKSGKGFFGVSKMF